MIDTSNERLRTVAELVVTIALIGLAIYLYRFVPGPSADTVGTVIVTAVCAKWLQSGVQHQAERQAEKIQEVVNTVKSNGNV